MRWGAFALPIGLVHPTYGFDAMKKRHGRGVFDHNADYIAYQAMIVAHPVYAGMPGALDSEGRIVWQSSSGKGTSFYANFLARQAWWVAAADSLSLPGTGKDKERCTIAARRIHPTGKRPCLVCGTVRDVGYFYANATLAAAANKILQHPAIKKADSVENVLSTVMSGMGTVAGNAQFIKWFPERASAFSIHGITPEAFHQTRHIRSRLLSPGFMGDAPYRLDGFHDYCLTCRPGSDPGRSEENMRSYNHDRRAFEWWAEGNWELADALYNSAGSGVCAICEESVSRVSPDHPGPLSCGFKHMPLFIPTCHSCNSSKNRRMRVADVEFMRDHERRTGDTVASRQVRPFWDAHKAHVSTKAEAELLSTALRELQHHYLSLLHDLLLGGRARFLRTLLAPEHALVDVEFEGLDRSTFKYSAVRETANHSEARLGLASRVVRIAFDELAVYNRKPLTRRKVSSRFGEQFAQARRDVLQLAASLPLTPLDAAWSDVILGEPSAEEREKRISQLPLGQSEADEKADAVLKSALDGFFEEAGRVRLDFASDVARRNS